MNEPRGRLAGKAAISRQLKRTHVRNKPEFTLEKQS